MLRPLWRLQLTMTGNVPFRSLWRKNSSQILGPGKARQVGCSHFLPSVMLWCYPVDDQSQICPLPASPCSPEALHLHPCILSTCCSSNTVNSIPASLYILSTALHVFLWADSKWLHNKLEDSELTQGLCHSLKKSNKDGLPKCHLNRHHHWCSQLDLTPGLTIVLTLKQNKAKQLHGKHSESSTFPRKVAERWPILGCLERDLSDFDFQLYHFLAVWPPQTSRSLWTLFLSVWSVTWGEWHGFHSLLWGWQQTRCPRLHCYHYSSQSSSSLLLPPQPLHPSIILRKGTQS